MFPLTLFRQFSLKTGLSVLCASMAGVAWAEDVASPDTIPITPMEVAAPANVDDVEAARVELDQWNATPSSGEPAADGIEASEEMLEVVAETPALLDLDANLPPRDLTLQEAVDLALAKNLGLSIVRYSPGLAQDQLAIAKAGFDPTISASATVNSAATPPASTLAGVTSGQAINDSQRLAVGVTKRFTPGTEVTLDTRVFRSTTNSTNALLNPDFATRVGLSIRQPLLAGFGEEVNLAAITRAQIGVRSSRLDVRREVLDLIAEVEVTYWSLAAAREQQALFLSNLRLARSLLDENVERERVGLATRLDVLQAEASLAARSEEVIVSQETADNLEDELRAVLGILYVDTLEPLAVQPLPLDDPYLPAFRESVQGALANDMESQIQFEFLDQLEVDRLVASNRTLPDLDLVGGAGVLGRDSDGFGAYQSAFESRGYDWFVGLELSLPWGMRAEEARERSSVRTIYRAETRMAEIQQELLRRLRLAWRSIAAGRERVATTRASLRLNEESFVQERARYDSGLSSFRNVLEAQRDFDTAKLRDLTALFELRRAVVVLARLDGRLLEQHGFTWEEIDNDTQNQPEPVDALAEELWPSPDFKRFNEDPDKLPESYGPMPDALRETYLGTEKLQQ